MTTTDTNTARIRALPKGKSYWIINIHTEKVYHYDDLKECRADRDNDPHPEDWIITKPTGF